MPDVAEVLIDYDVQVQGPDNKMYVAKACGRQRDDERWEAWIEFTPVGGGDPVRTGRETTQPKRHHLVYWATGITASYLEGALVRTLRQDDPTLRPRPNPSERPSVEDPADHPFWDTDYPPPNALLDPFHVEAMGADLLRSQLSALGKEHLVNIVKAYRLSNEDPSVLDEMRQDEMIALILKAVRARKTP